MQALATNDEGDGPWLASDTGRTNLPPGIERVEISSDPGADTTYARGDVIEVAVTFTTDVFVTGSSQLTLMKEKDERDWRSCHERVTGSMDAKIGERCEIPGLYESDCRHRERKLIRQGKRFPYCMACRHVVFWHLVRPIG